MKIAICSDSTIDIQDDLIKKYDVTIIPYTIVMDGQEVPDENILPDTLYEYTKRTGKLPKTCAVNVAQCYEVFKRLIDEGNDYVLFWTLSQSMSSTYQNALIAAKEFDGKVFVIDSEVVSVGICLEIDYFRRLEATGKFSVEEMIAKIKKRIPHICGSFILGTTEYLYKGGRCSALAHIGAKILGLRPEIILKDGTMKPHKLYRGKNNIVTKKYMNDKFNEYNNPDYSIAFVAGTNAPEETKDQMVNILKEKGFKEIHKSRANACISTHGGPNAYGFGYWNDGGDPDLD